MWLMECELAKKRVFLSLYNQNLLKQNDDNGKLKFYSVSGGDCGTPD